MSRIVCNGLVNPHWDAPSSHSISQQSSIHVLTGHLREFESLQKNLNGTLRLEAQLQHLILQAQKPRANLNRMDDIVTAGLCPIRVIERLRSSTLGTQARQRPTCPMPSILSLYSKRSRLYQANDLIPIR
ncbi:hypothetical protein PSHT_13933 [Puccinia striiformis]|uniref:Uncharacterized protein n=3 Tax=Puccinia striiformis TaxID=27350 RepID=A0A0L0VC47_9BASI|nr:hypothetical protein KEM48_006902 [Puccinia striiformis f. sp. tritici PST-130]KNE96882.1 hypothetical protein PSTG_09866 [Puccinia striiformis f. sp. tritici PST-78]POV98611.1 hypothetical protein PSHT_13933 [Puccinia striiformis]POW07446.1 hypothetical protein PSTT_08223 [Puccinia striiformis]